MFFWRAVVECLTWDKRAGGSSLTSVTALCPWARHINPSLVNTGSTQEDLSLYNWNIVDWDLKNQIKQTKNFQVVLVFYFLPIHASFHYLVIPNYTVCNLHNKYHIWKSVSRVVTLS